MNALRWVLLLGCVGCVALVVWNARWEGRLTLGNHTWIVDLGRAPIWAPPTNPTYATFHKGLGESKGFPSEGTPGVMVTRVLKADWMALDLLLYLWPITVAVGPLYLATRQRRRDLILHVALSAGIGLTASAVACVGLWLMFGGWGPPSPEFFGGLGLIGGIIVGVASFSRESAEPAA